MPSLKSALTAAVLASLASAASAAVDLVVPGTSNLWLAGQPEGTVALDGVDAAPTQSPVRVDGISLDAGAILAFEASGGVANDPDIDLDGPDGGGFVGWTGHDYGVENGISNSYLPFNSLIGVFIGGVAPDPDQAPEGLDFSVIGTDFAELAPQLQQAFFIGDGLASDGSLQRFVVPAGAQTLYLGTADSQGWFNNIGSFSVKVSMHPVPEPGTVALCGLGISFAVGVGRRRAAVVRPVAA